MPLYLQKARENVEIPPFTLDGDDISGVEDFAATSGGSDQFSRQGGVSKSGSNSNSSFHCFSNISARSDLSLNSAESSYQAMQGEMKPNEIFKRP